MYVYMYVWMDRWMDEFEKKKKKIENDFIYS